MWRVLDLRSRYSSPLITSGGGELIMLSELSDDMLDDDQSHDDSDLAEELTSAEKEKRLRNLVPSLPAEEWGRKTEKPSPETAIKPRSNTKTTSLPKMRPPILAKEEYDGVVDDSDDDMSDDDLPPPGTLGRRIAEMKWSEGESQADKITELEEAVKKDKKVAWDDGIDEAMRKRVWGDDADAVDGGDDDGDIDMGQEEAEFLKFSREALGITDDQWEGILSSRRDRGGMFFFDH